MSKGIPINKIAPDFELKDFNGKPVRLSNYCQKKNVFLVFNRGFT
jgi:peroxiredoxin